MAVVGATDRRALVSEVTMFRSTFFSGLRTLPIHWIKTSKKQVNFHLDLTKYDDKYSSSVIQYSNEMKFDS